MKRTISVSPQQPRDVPSLHTQVGKSWAVSVRPHIWLEVEYAEMLAGFLAAKIALPIELQLDIGVRTFAYRIVVNRSNAMASKNGIGKWNGFADINLSKAQVKSAKTYANDRDKVVDDLENIVGSQYKVTISVDTRTDVHMCSVSCYDRESPNFKYSMVTRGKSAWGVLAAAMYKHWYVAKGNWEVEDDVEIDF